MKTILLAFALFLTASIQAQAEGLKIVATFPELADMAREIGGSYITVTGIARGTEDPHQIVMKPSYAVKLNEADGVIFNGLTLEHSFLPALLEAAANPRMVPDTFQTCVGAGCIDCSNGIHILEKPADISRSQGELHPAGNPHYELGPQNGPVVAKNIEEGLSRLDPAHAAEYKKNYEAYEAKLKSSIEELKKMAAPLKGIKAISHHEDIAYLAAFTGIDFIDTVELKPGVPPTPPHMEKLVEEMKAQGVTLVVREQQYSAKDAQWLADQTGAKVAVIGVMAHAFPDTDTFIKFQEHNIKALLAAIGKGPS
jgi:zinc/manganese transport system substrate-binding protein